MTRFIANKGRPTLSLCRTFFTLSRLAGALAALWLCGTGAAWAGDGGDLASLQNVANGLCTIFKMTTCPQLPTITQAMLEVAGLTNSPPEMVAAQNSIAPGYNVIAGNPATQPYAPNFLPISFPLPVGSTTSTTVSELLSTLTPIAFISQKSGTAAPAQLYDPSVDSFLYAVGVSSSGTGNSGTGNLTNPDTVYFFYDDLGRVAQNFTKNQIVAKFSFPLTVLNGNGSENAPVMVTLEVLAICNGGPSCLQAYVSGGGITPSTPASDLGIQFALVFSASPTSTQKHAIFEVAVPLLVTGACAGDSSLCVGGQLAMPPSIPTANTDPPYFYSAITGKPGNVSTAPLTGNFSIYTAFGAAFPPDDLGATLPTGVLPAPAHSIGLAPSSGSPSSFTFALCATLPDNSNGPAAHLRPAVGAYYAIATDGETLIGAPLAPVVASVCPAL
jgi:hypothetical protein